MLELLSGFETIHELVTLFEELIHTACTSMRQMSGDHEDERLECIRQYVEENCFDPEFSIYSTARHFALTPSNLSHYFKTSPDKAFRIMFRRCVAPRPAVC